MSAVAEPTQSLLAEDSAVISKTKELCASIVKDPVFLQLQADVERFLNDDAAKLQYQSVHERGEQLHHKQHAGIELGAAEIREFEAARDALFDNPIAADFLAAQRELEGLQKTIGKYVSSTIENGKVPSAEDLVESSGGCCGGGGGGGCGC
ncbi:MAG: YlbF family regulator [Verrucomicrobiota bacterium]